MMNTNVVGKPLCRVMMAVAIMLLSLQAMAYDFSYTYQGKTLYYEILAGGTNEVRLTYYYLDGSDTANNHVSGDVVIPSSVEHNNVTYSVTSIGDSAFRNCSDLTSVSIPNSVTSIGHSAFRNCSGLTSVTLPYGVTSISGSAFRNCSGLTSVTLPNSLRYIDGGAFFGCSGLTSITIPNSVTFLGGSAFRNCSGLTSVTLPNSFNTIADGTFFGCSSLTSISIPNSITSIGNNTFYGCSSLTSISIPNSVIYIRSRAFFGCSGLTSVTIGNSLTSIAAGAFNGCTNLSSLVSLATVPPTIDNETFPYPNTCMVTVPCGSLEAYTTSDWNTYFAGRISEDLSFELSVSANDEAYGRVEVETQSCEVAIITATPNEGYEFTRWSDGNTENPRTVSLTSDTAFVAIFTASGSSSLQAVNAREFALYPNPAKSFVTLEFETLQENALLQILDINGRRLRTFDLKAGVETLRIDLGDLPKGVYTITIGNTTKKLIVE